MRTVLLSIVLQATVTPGVVRPLSSAQICTIHWGRDVRHVTERMKQDVALLYRLDRAAIVGRGKGVCCEFDHKIPRELGGADSVANIWPQPWVEAHLKDVEENHYHQLVCAGALTLVAAQDHFRQWETPHAR